MAASHGRFVYWTTGKEAVNTNFYSLWFDPTGNQTRVYRFSSRSSIHSTTDHCQFGNLWLTLNLFITVLIRRTFMWVTLPVLILSWKIAFPDRTGIFISRRAFNDSNFVLLQEFTARDVTRIEQILETVSTNDYLINVRESFVTSQMITRWTQKWQY